MYKRSSCHTATSNCIILLLWMLCLQRGHSHLQTAFEQVVGRWDVQLHRMQSEQFFNTLVFAPSLQTTNHSSHLLHSPKPTTPWKRSSSLVSCSLYIHPNGTFTLRKETSSDSQLHDSSTAPTLPVVQGYWTIQTNPYCVTDRFYDELYMVSHPRVQIRRNETLVSKKKKKIVVPWSRHPLPSSPIPVRAQAILEFRSRVWGRYSSQAIQHTCMRVWNRGGGVLKKNVSRPPRMTHGTCTLLMERGREEKDEEKLIKGKDVDGMKRRGERQGDDDDDDDASTRIISNHWIVASFRARANRDPNSFIPWNKKNKEDYDLDDYYDTDE